MRTFGKLLIVVSLWGYIVLMPAPASADSCPTTMFEMGLEAQIISEIRALKLAIAEAEFQSQTILQTALEGHLRRLLAEIKRSGLTNLESMLILNETQKQSLVSKKGLTESLSSSEKESLEKSAWLLPKYVIPSPGPFAPRTSLSISPDQRIFATSGAMESGPTIYDLKTGATIIELPTQADGGTSVKFSPDGKAILVSSALHPRLFSYDGKNPARVQQTDLPAVQSLVYEFSPDSQFLLCGSFKGTLEMWDIKAKKMVFSFPAGAQVPYTFMSLDQKYIHLTAGNKSLVLSNSGKEVPALAKSFPNRIEAEVSSRDRKVVASAYQLGNLNWEVEIWEFPTGRTLNKLSLTAHRVPELNLSPEGNSIAITTETGSILVFDLNSVVPKHKFESGAPNFTFQTPRFSPDGKFVAAQGSDHKIWVWSIESGSLVDTFEGHTEFIADFQFTQDNSNLISVSRDGSARVWSRPKFD